MIKSKKKLFLTIVVLSIFIVSLAIFLNPDERTVANFCDKVVKVDSDFKDSDGDTYSLSFLDHRSSDAGDFADALKQLEESSPDEIQSDVKTLRQIFEKIDDDPSQALSASLAGIGPENSIKTYISENCEIN